MKEEASVAPDQLFDRYGADVQGREVWKKSLTGRGTHREPVRLPAQSVGTFIILLDKEATAAKGKTEYKRVIVVK